MAAQTYRVLYHELKVETTVANVLSIRDVDVTIYDQTTYRDDPVPIAGIQGRDDSIAGCVTTGTATAIAGLNSGLAVYVGDAQALKFDATPSATPATYAADPVAHVAPRFMAKKTTWTYMFSALSVSKTVGTTNNSNTVTVTNTTGIAVGDVIIGADIPSGSIVLSIVANTSVTISQAATATASITAIFSSGDVLFRYEASKIAISTGAHSRIS